MWDPAQDALWATCDNGCQGRSSIIKIDANAGAHQGTFQIQSVYSRPTRATQNLNNEGFTVQPLAECIDGSRRAFWSDDSDDGNHWLRSAWVDCTPDTTKPTITATPTPAANAFGWNNTGVTVSFTCTDASDIDEADSSLEDQVLTVSGTATGICVDNAGNTATASYTAQIDVVNPTITFTGNSGRYGILDTVAISCTASDGQSGIDTVTCPGANGSAWSFGAGSHTLAAHATDKAGNTTSTSTSFTVAVKPADLAKLTTQFVTSSAKYQSSNAVTKLVVMKMVSVATAAILKLTPNTKPAVKAALIAVYKTELAALVAGGYLTPAQQATLVALAQAI
jgi:hypothetical protein